MISNSSRDLTLRRTSVLFTLIWPTSPKKVFIFIKSGKSLRCKVIEKVGERFQPERVVLDLLILTTKEPSASVKPVTHQGFKGEGEWVEENLEVKTPKKEKRKKFSMVYQIYLILIFIMDYLLRTLMFFFTYSLCDI